MRKKGLEGVDAFSTERVARAIDNAEALVSQTIDASRRIGDRMLEGRIERLCDQARDVFRVVVEERSSPSPGPGGRIVSTVPTKLQPRQRCAG